MTSYSNVSARAMLVSLHISLWSARKFDKKATAQVNTDNSAAADASRVNKHLLAGAKSHEGAVKAAINARDTHYKQTLPWTDEGWRLLPTANYVKYTDVMRKRHSEFDSAVETFLQDYPALMQSAPQRLGGLYKADDFPPVRQARSRFGWSIDIKPVPSAGDLRVELPADEVARIEQRITESIEASTREAMTGAWQRLHEAVARIHKATEVDGVLRNNLLDHAADVCDVLGRLNVAGDETLDALRKRVSQDLVASVGNVEHLRNDDKLRASTQKKAADIMAAMAAHYAPPAKDVE
jgi:hypothetical protein